MAKMPALPVRFARRGFVPLIGVFMLSYRADRYFCPMVFFGYPYAFQLWCAATGFRFDMRQARRLLAVVEHGNMLRAASAMHISRPALS